MKPILLSTLPRSCALLALALTAAGCDGERVAQVYFEMVSVPFAVGDSATFSAALAQETVAFPFASSYRVLYSADERPGAFTFSVSDTAVAELDAARRRVRFRKPGSFRIHVRVEGLSGESGEYRVGREPG
jgi:hypothetical protein